MSSNIIEVKNLTKIYENGNVLAVDGINFSIKKGEIFALLGPNGAGKTTTINMLATLLDATNGEAIVNSYNVKDHPGKVRRSIGMVFQETAVDIEMTGWENLEIHAILYGMAKKERRAKIREVLQLVDLEDKANIYVKNYSGGMKRRLEIARGLIHEPIVLFLDEPTLGLDPQTRRKIWEKIKELNQGVFNMTILITTHYMEEADELADRICIMDHGKIIALDTSKNLKEQLSGDIIDVEFENIGDKQALSDIVSILKKLTGVKDITFSDKTEVMDTIPQDMPLPPGMKNIDMNIIKARMQEMMANPKKMIQAWKKFPMASQMFLNAPLIVKKKIADLFNDELLEEVPDPIKTEIIKIKKDEIGLDSKEIESKISISCENGRVQLPKIIQKINDNNLSIKNVSMHHPTLEDVFLFYTGEDIREESGTRVKNIKNLIQMRQIRK
ncbi:MAG: ATP-binding cassette domain-containing protein [Candidatus Hermodarchaeota archaeon]